MGLIINATDEKTITITGTEINVPNVYGRIEFAGRADGKTLEIAIATYASKEAFENGASALSTDVPQGNINAELKESEIQGLETAHEYAKSAFEQLGYAVEVNI